MKRHIAYALALLIGSACSPDGITAGGPISPSSPASTAAAQPPVPVNYRAHLSGREVVTPLPIPTLAQGQAVFQLSPDGLELSYQVMVANIENVIGFHLHRAAVGVRGPLVFAISFPPAGGRTDGVLAEGTIRAANLLGPLFGKPLSDLIGDIEAGLIYVDVNTNDGIPPGNTGPGDYNGGELRGQVR
jgi:CHRD domain-containing protein